MGNYLQNLASSSKTTASTQTATTDTAIENNSLSTAASHVLSLLNANMILTWDDCHTLVSMPQRALWLDHDLIIFSSEYEYERLQFIRVNLRNTSEDEHIVFWIKWWSHFSQWFNSDDNHEQYSDVALLKFMAFPNKGIIAPGETVQFKLILPNHAAWGQPKETVVNKRTNILIQQMCVNDPKSFLGRTSFDANDEDLKRKLEELISAISLSENRIEKIYSHVVPVFIPKNNKCIDVRISLAIENIGE